MLTFDKTLADRFMEKLSLRQPIEHDTAWTPEELFHLAGAAGAIAGLGMCDARMPGRHAEHEEAIGDTIRRSLQPLFMFYVSESLLLLVERARELKRPSR